MNTMTTDQLTKPDWGTWVTRVDTSGSANPPQVWLSASETIATLALESHLDLNLSSDDGQRAASAVLVGHLPLVLPDDFPLQGYFVTCDGSISKSPNSSATLTITVGHGAHCLQWPRVVAPPMEVEESIVPSFFVSDPHVATGPDRRFPPPPPLTVSVGLHVQRAADDEFVLANLTTLTIAMLTDMP